MEAGQNVPQLGRYVYAEFTGKVPDDYECLVCHLPMKDPVQIFNVDTSFVELVKSRSLPWREEC